MGRAGVGIDNVDLQAATEVGCLVVNAPTANTVAAAEHGIALLTALARNVAPASASMKAGKLSLVFQGSHISLIFTSPYSQLFQEINKYNLSELLLVILQGSCRLTLSPVHHTTLASKLAD